MRYFKILLLHFEDVMQARSRSFVWFLMSVVNPLILIAFWSGATSGSATIGGFSKSELNTYYLILIIATTCLISHIEDKIGKYDIREGGLVRYLTRPFSYFWLCFFHEIPYRILQGIFGLIGFFILSFFIKTVHIPTITIFTFIILVSAYVLSYLMQSVIGLCAFWITEINGIFNTMEVVRVVLSGIIVPLTFLPYWLASITYILPFSYLTYFPIISLQGKASAHLQIWIIFMQVLWITIFIAIYKIMWRQGVKRFTGVGQ